MATLKKSLEPTVPTNKEKTFGDWTINCTISHILPSKCIGSCDDANPCIYCFFTKQLSTPHVPEMVYPNNKLRLFHKSGVTIEFNALEALKHIKNENKSVKIACAEDWRRARQDTGLVDKIIGEFDWTFTTDYKGTWNYCSQRKNTEMTIDMNKLKQREEILMYEDITLFEDELHDNGISLCSVRMRVMPSGFFILLRFFLRVDGVIITVNDTRIHHEFNTDYVLTESTHRESKVSELKAPLYIMNQPDEITPLLPLISATREKIDLTPSGSS